MPFNLPIKWLDVEVWKFVLTNICDAPSENHDMDYLTIFIVAFSVVNDN